MPTSLSDAEEIRLALKGDHEAFCRLYDRYAGLVRSVVAAVAGDLAAVDDLTQETFLRAYQKLATLRNVNRFRFWLQGIARRVARERRRDLQRHQHRTTTQQVDELPDRPHPDASRLYDTETRETLMAAVATLPERERLVVHAYFFHEQDVSQAADAIGVSRSGFYAALQRALNRLRHALGVSQQTRTETKQ
ncbi:MAG: sigma-70 family RNA polymerase sigma factor [Planctomycetales bacterium]|nr:sigma-70 family RNA polymerase sigma factor [Planctomycetales bacterium]